MKLMMKLATPSRFTKSNVGLFYVLVVVLGFAFEASLGHVGF